MRYGQGIGEGSDESDGRGIWRILTASPPGGHGRDGPERAARPGFVVALVLVALATLAADPTLALALVVLFGLAFWMQRTAPG